MKTLKDFDFNNKRVLVRCDFNVPVLNVIIQDDFRIREALPTIRFLLEKKAKVILMSHLEDKDGNNLSLEIVRESLQKHLGREVLMANGSEIKEGGVALLENLRFNKGEKENSEDFAKQLAKLGDIYINEAFSVCHRAHASIALLPLYLPSGAGLLLEKEINFLSRLIDNPARPFTALIGGAKISSKARMIKSFLEKADQVILGGKVANAVLQARGDYKSRDPIENINFDLNSPKLFLQTDAVLSSGIACKINKMKERDIIFDIGPESIKMFSEIIAKAKTIVIAGPMGFFEKQGFEQGTKEILKAIAENKQAFSVVGGGDSVSAVFKYNLQDKFSHISTGGGAMLAYLGGEKLPGIEALN